MRYLRVIFGTALAFALVFRLAAPASARPTPAQLVVTCTQWGYSFQTPGNWLALNKKCPAIAVGSPDRTMVFAAFADAVHGTWKDAQARTSITADFKRYGKVLYAVSWSTETIHEHHFLNGATAIRSPSGTENIVVELESVTRGTLYKFLAVVAPAQQEAVTNARLNTIGAIENSIHISGKA